MREGRGRPLTTGVVLLLVVGAISWWRYGPPAPVAEDAPPATFSAGRAYRVLGELVGDGVPHPLGSAQGRVVRERIRATLGTLQIATEVHAVWHHDGYGRVMRLENVIGKIAARSTARGAARGAERKPIVLMAHSDSVPAGPGAGDDAAGCAVLLEVARALRAAPALRHPVWLLFTDGEEAGMLGASAFLADYAKADDVHAVINVEGRGTSGPSFMFETAPNNRALIARFASAVSRPSSTSLFESFYRRMPNDTDFSIFRRAGVMGYNFAYVGNVGFYHTTRDTVANVDPGSIQHHGEQVLALVRAIGESDEALTATEDAVFFDVLGFGLIHWPASWSWWLLGLALALLLSGGWMSGERLSDVLRGVAVWSASVVSVIAVGYGLGYWAVPIRAWFGLPAWLAWASLALAVAVCFGAGCLARAVGFWALWYGGWIAAAGVAAALMVYLPGAEYLFLVPALVAGVTGSVARALRRDSAEGSILVVIAPAAIGALLAYPILFGMMDGFGPIVAGPAAILVAPLIPLCPLARRRDVGRSAAAALVLAGLVAIASGLAPRDEATKPHRANLIYNQAGDAGRWWVESAVGLPTSATTALATTDVIKWRPSRGHRARRKVAPLAKGPAMPTFAEPTLALVSSSDTEDGTRLTLRATSPRGARILTLVFPVGYVYTDPAVRVDGERLSVKLAKRAKQGYALSCLTTPDAGLEVELTVRPAQGPFRGIEIVVTDTSLGLGGVGGGVVGTRDGVAVQDREGDLVVVSAVRRVG